MNSHLFLGVQKKLLSLPCFRAKLGMITPFFVLFNLAISGALCVYAVSHYLGIASNFIIGLISMSIIFGIYSINRFTDGYEDFSNSSERTSLLLHKYKLLYAGAILLTGSIIYLTFTQKLNAFHLCLVCGGLCYSLPVFPLYSKDKGVYFVKLKKIIFVKNLLVAVLWGLSIFLVPVLFVNHTISWDLNLYLLLGSITIGTLSNTTFNDIRDEIGDRLANNPTLPVVIGGKKTALLILSWNVLWVLCILLLSLLDKISLITSSVLIFMGLYPFFYIVGFYKKWFSNKNAEPISDFCFTIFAISVFVLEYFK